MTTTPPAPHPGEPTAPSRHPLAPLFSAGTVRARSAQVLRSVERDLSASFKLDGEALAQLARRVAAQLAAADPAAPAPPQPAAAPFWRHLQAGGIDRLAELQGLLAGLPAAERTRAWLDLTVVGVLMAADPGPRWRCSEHSALPPAAFAQSTPDELLAMLDRAGKTAPAAPATAAAAAAAAVSAGPTVATNAAAPAAAEQPAQPEHAEHAEQAAQAAQTGALPAEAETVLAPPSPSPSPPPPSAPASTPPPPAVPGATYGGFEGLAVATFRAFVAGAFSADKAHPCRVDAGTLRHIDVAAVRAILHGTPQNPVQGLEGRAAVLARLGQLLQALPGAGGAHARPCDLVQAQVAAAAAGADIRAAELLSELLRTLAPLWPTAPVQGLPGGDIWQHRWAGEVVGAAAPDNASAAVAAPKDLGTGGWVPLHARGQALVAALALPLQHSGQPLVALQDLTAVADQPTSSLLLAAGVLVPRQPRLLSRSLKLGDEAVIECRALTVALFDELTRQVQALLQPRWGSAAATLSTAQVVQATETLLADSGASALRIEGDGALF